MYFDRTKLKQVTIDDLEIGQSVYEDKNGLINYCVDKSFDKEANELSIPLLVVNDPNRYFKRNQLVYRNISNLLFI